MLDKNGNSITPKEELWNWVDDLFKSAMSPDTINVAGMTDATLRRIWDDVKHCGIQIICTKDQAEKMEQWRKEEEPAV
jgi:hypothetical protein